MGEKKKIETNQFWSGFGLGVLLGGTLAYFLEDKEEVKKEKILKIIHQLLAGDFKELDKTVLHQNSSSSPSSVAVEVKPADKPRVFKRGNRPLK